MKAPLTEDLATSLREHKILFKTETDSTTGDITRWANDPDKRQQFEAVKRWYYEDWKRVEPRLKTSIVEGISVFLSLFDDNPAVKRVFCPPKEAYDPVANHEGRLGKPLPPLSELLEQGAVLALNLPIATNPGLAKTIGTLLKQDFQRAVLNRIPRMEREPRREWRPLLPSFQRERGEPQRPREDLLRHVELLSRLPHDCRAHARQRTHVEAVRSQLALAFSV